MHTTPYVRARRFAVATLAALLLTVAVPGAATATPDPDVSALTAGADSGPTDSYVVEVEDGTSAAVVEMLAQAGLAPEVEFEAVLDGFSVELTQAQATALAQLDAVEGVTPDQAFQITSVQEPATWGLDRIDQPDLPLDKRFTYPPSAGTGVRVYVVDTGVSAHADLGSRLAAGYSGFPDGFGTADCHGHGTHVAGTAASTTYGVAKSAWVVPVRVLDCVGDGSTTTVLAGLDWIVAHHPKGTPGVINMSITGPKDTALNNAVAGLVTKGFTVVVAAGNDNVDACKRSPAAAPAAVTVGATTKTDARAAYSNWGACLDLFAPGSEITSLSPTGPTAVATSSGTSMAAPHASGVAALYLGMHPGATPAQVTAVMLAATSPVVTGAGTSSTRSLLSSRVDATLPSAPRNLRGTGASASSLTLAWDTPTTSAGHVTDYTVQRSTNRTAWTTVARTPSTARTQTVKGLSSGTRYWVRVAALSGAQAGPWSTSVALTTTQSPNPTERYVTSVYRRLFDRVPDPAGLAHWTAALDGGAPRNVVADSITSSAEYRSRLIQGSYRTYLQRSADSAGLQHWLDQLGRGMTIQEMESGFVASSEYYQRSGSTPRGWVRALYVDVLGRTPSASEISHWTGEMSRGASRQQVARGFLLSAEHLGTVIDGHYRDLLDRGLDPTGRASWVAAIQRGTRVEVVIGGIIASSEYWSRNT